MDEKAPYSMSEEQIPKEPPPNYDEAMAATSGGSKNDMQIVILEKINHSNIGKMC